MAKKIFILVILTGVVFFSGCSISSLMGKKKPATPPQVKKGSIWKSVDGGTTFAPKITLEAPPVTTDVAANEKEKAAVKPPEITSADILTITFHPKDSNIIYVGTVNNGIFKTVNGGELWKYIKFPPQKIDSFTLDRNDPDKRMFASGVLGGVGKVFRTEDGGENWKEAYSEPGQKTQVTSLSQHFKDTNVIFAGTSGGTVIKSTDGGQTWKNIGQTIDGPVTEIPFDATKKLTVYALSYGKKMYYSSNGGEKWIEWEVVKKEEIKALKDKESKLRKEKNVGAADNLKKYIDTLEEKNRKEAMPSGIISLTASPFISGTLYAGTKNGQFHRSVDYGKYWKKINIIESASKFPIRMVTVSYSNKNELAFVSGMAFYKSLNGGETWAVTQIDADRPVSVISYDPKDSKVLYLGIGRDK